MVDDEVNGQKYCDQWNLHNQFNFDQCIIASGNVLDCSANGDDLDVHALGCQLNHLTAQNITDVLINFPQDITNPLVRDFGKGESANFFKDFNGATSEFNKKRKSLKFYGTKFDLAVLDQNTNASLTEEVTIMADTVYISKPISISYKLKIRARIVSIDQQLSMKMSADQFHSQSKLRTHYEQAIVFSKETKVRHRHYGLVSIVDTAPSTTDDFHHPICHHKQFSPSEVDTTDSWFDETLVNLLFVCASTVQPESNDLALEIAKFYMDFYNDREVVGDKSTFVAAQKFQQVVEVGKSWPRPHNVPSFTLSTIKELSSLMYEKLHLYKENEDIQQQKLSSAFDKIQDIQLQMEIVEKQQEFYFEMEQNILNEIMESTSNVWTWTFQHRNISDSAIHGALGATGDLTIDMQENELKIMLEEAQFSVDYYQDVVDNFRKEVGRYQEKTTGSITIIKDLNLQFQDAVEDLKIETDKFEVAVHAYIAKQVVKTFLSFMKNILTLGAAVVAEDPGAIIEGVFESIEILLEIVDLMVEIIDLLVLVEENGSDGFDSLTSNPSTDFSTAMKQAIELRLKGPKFDELKRNAMIQLDDVNEATNHEIDGTADLMSAHVKLADLGYRLVTETSTLADTLLSLANVKGELEVGKNQLNRSIEQVEVIMSSIDNFNQSSANYQDEMNAIQQEYQDALKRMEEQFENMTQEMKDEFMKDINDRFQNYQSVYSDMKERYTKALDATIDAVQDKIYGLRQSSMTQRSLAAIIYRDYCDTLFYHSFEHCNEENVPLLGDEMDVLLDKLHSIQWDLITNINDLPEPIIFEHQILIEDDESKYISPINQMLKTSRTTINLKDFLPESEFYKQWRWRISELEVYLLDENSAVISSPGTGMGEGISLGITFPPLFNDTAFDRVVHPFLAHPFYCRSTYETSSKCIEFMLTSDNFTQTISGEGDHIFSEKCQVDHEFTNSNYQTSPDGDFAFKLRNDESTLDFNQVKKLMVWIHGSYIPFKEKKQNFSKIATGN